MDRAFARVFCITWITVTLWQGGVADKAIIRSSGKIFSEVLLSRNKIISVPGLIAAHCLEESNIELDALKMIE